MWARAAPGQHLARGLAGPVLALFLRGQALQGVRGHAEWGYGDEALLPDLRSHLEGWMLTAHAHLANKTACAAQSARNPYLLTAVWPLWVFSHQPSPL